MRSESITRTYFEASYVAFNTIVDQLSFIRLMKMTRWVGHVRDDPGLVGVPRPMLETVGSSVLGCLSKSSSLA